MHFDAVSKWYASQIYDRISLSNRFSYYVSRTHIINRTKTTACISAIFWILFDKSITARRGSNLNCFYFAANWGHMEVQDVEMLVTTQQWNIWASEKWSDLLEECTIQKHFLVSMNRCILVITGHQIWIATNKEFQSKHRNKLTIIEDILREQIKKELLTELESRFMGIQILKLNYTNQCIAGIMCVILKKFTYPWNMMWKAKLR